MFVCVCVCVCGHLVALVSELPHDISKVSLERFVPARKKFLQKKVSAVTQIPCKSHYVEYVSVSKETF